MEQKWTPIGGNIQIEGLPAIESSSRMPLMVYSHCILKLMIFLKFKKACEINTPNYELYDTHPGYETSKPQETKTSTSLLGKFSELFSWTKEYLREISAKENVLTIFELFQIKPMKNLLLQIKFKIANETLESRGFSRKQV